MTVTYLIELNPDGTCDVTRDGRAFLYDRNDVQEAMTAIRSQRSRDGSGEIKVYVVELDGYRRLMRL